ncbi:uncharacterized protein KY384_005256 [Bacidia gigantensis]|uniref:uncharacterized protein n=1 Tax=Bacidia gigantensis TaxID=2732470 RepID=UPI001D04F1A3|nr:uncharacterized protein KY384_005256 [Bacidia gigantensis]KAG8529775.1 hypothetical protein KY384_005256 [Bacidia gigantensis]
MAWFRRYSTWLSLVVAVFALFGPASSVKHENFKTCDQSGFCRRNRAYADHVDTTGNSWASPYALDPKTVKAGSGRLTGTILKTVNQDKPVVELPLLIQFPEPGVARITIDEARRQKGDIELRHGSQCRKERYNEVSSWAMVGQPKGDEEMQYETRGKETVVLYGTGKKYKAIIKHEPFSIDFVRDEQVHVKINGKGLLNYEHWRPKVEREKPAEEGKQEGEEVKQDEQAKEDLKKREEEDENKWSWWDESFGGNTDTKPKGPESVALDVTFPEYEHVYGIPGHAGPLSLKETRGASGGYNDPYRLYNTDVFEYEMDSPMTLYGAIPLMYAQRKNSAVGIFWMNAAETWIDIVKEKQSSNPLSLGIGSKLNTRTHWISESGLIDLVVFMGPEPKDIIQQYTALTGKPQLPQTFSIGYHQCRWNYVSDEDVKDVDKKMSRYSIPYDVIWLDIEYSDSKKYFTWDSHSFPDPIGMEKHLDVSQRKLVVIIDPHIKNEGGYAVSEQLKSQNLAVKNKDNDIYDGWCWPGSSNWIDCFNPAARKWYNALYTYKSFTGTSPNVFLWNDMNEPSVFNGPETTMPKDNLHHGNWEHRDVHNLNGLTFHNATYEALLARDSPPKRPFVLTRSYYSGSQRVGAMWTGDNQASWPHLAASIPMLLSMNIAGFPFAGADVGAGAFYPFFRGHAHIDSRRREPYLAGSPYTQIITQAIRLRYQLLPAFYTAFHTAHTYGYPIMRPNWYVHPDDEAGFALENQFYLGDTGLLAAPVLTEGAESVDVYLPSGYTYYDYFTYTPHVGSGKTVTIPAPLDKIPLLMQAGHIIPRKDRPRRSTGLMKWDPYTLLIVLGGEGKAVGELYVDDGESFDYQSGAYIHRRFEFEGGKLTSKALANPGAGRKVAREYVKSMKDVVVERVVIVNAPKNWEGGKHVSVTEEGGKERKVELQWFEGNDGGVAWAVVKNPRVAVGVEWGIQF